MNNIDYLDKTLEIKIDRPLGSKHPKHGFIYPVNYGYVPNTAQKTVAEYLNIPLADVYGVVTFYSRFTTVPKGKYDISVCMGTACFVKGSQSILERAKEKLGIDEGQTTEDQLFSLETMRCVGACGLAPVFTVNNKVYGKATVKKLDEVIDELRANGGN